MEIIQSLSYSRCLQDRGTHLVIVLINPSNQEVIVARSVCMDAWQDVLMESEIFYLKSCYNLILNVFLQNFHVEI